MFSYRGKISKNLDGDLRDPCTAQRTALVFWMAVCPRLVVRGGCLLVQLLDSGCVSIASAIDFHPSVLSSKHIPHHPSCEAKKLCLRDGRQRESCRETKDAVIGIGVSDPTEISHFLTFSHLHLKIMRGWEEVEGKMENQWSPVLNMTTMNDTKNSKKSWRWYIVTTAHYEGDSTLCRSVCENVVRMAGLYLVMDWYLVLLQSQ